MASSMIKSMFSPKRTNPLRTRNIVDTFAADVLPSIPIVVADERIYADPMLRDWDSKSFGEHLDRAWFER